MPLHFGRRLPTQHTHHRQLIERRDAIWRENRTTIMSPTISTTAAVVDAMLERSSVPVDVVVEWCRTDPHKAAIAMNNMAVSMLDRGLVREALATLEDAVILIGNASVQAELSSSSLVLLCEGSSSVAISITEEDIRLALDRTSRRATVYDKNHSTSTNATGLGVSVQSHPHPHLKVISSQSNPTRVYEALTSSVDCHSVKASFPMKIDPIDNERCTVDDVFFEASTVMYNYGVALDCMTDIPHDGGSVFFDTTTAYMQHAMFRRRAHHFYHSARALLYKIDQDNFLYAPIALASQMLLLRTVLTHNMLNASIQLHLTEEYEEYRLAMAALLYYVEFQHSFLPIQDQDVAAAA